MDDRGWLRVRRELRDRRYELAISATGLYPDATYAAGTPLLSTVDWLPAGPVPLDRIALRYADGAPPPALTGREAVTAHLRPDGYARYSDATAALAAPAVFADLPTYRLLGADLATAPALVFGAGTYFDSADVGDAVAHEYTAATLGELAAQPFRTAIGDPCDLTRRPVNLAITTLTLRYDRENGTATFPLHARDAATVGHAGGMYQVLPVGVFQPAGPQEWNIANDFDLWRGMVREYAEELLGAEEEYGTETAPIDYEAWPFAAAMTAAIHAGHIRPYCLGLGVDPLTLATDLLTTVVIDARTYDNLFSATVAANAEGTVTAAVPFTAQTTDRYATHEPTQAAAAAVLRLAWQHRAVLLGAAGE